MNTSSLIESVTKRFPDGVSASHSYRGDATVVLRRESLLQVARFLKEDPGRPSVRVRSRPVSGACQRQLTGHFLSQTVGGPPSPPHVPEYPLSQSPKRQRGV